MRACTIREDKYIIKIAVQARLMTVLVLNPIVSISHVAMAEVAPADKKGRMAETTDSMRLT